MFREEYQAVCGAAKKKVEFLEKNPLGYVAAAFLAGMFVGLGCVLMGVVDFIPVGQIYQTLVPIALALGLGIGLVGSFITTRKHLKV